MTTPSCTKERILRYHNKLENFGKKPRNFELFCLEFNFQDNFVDYLRDGLALAQNGPDFYLIVSQDREIFNEYIEMLSIYSKKYFHKHQIIPTSLQQLIRREYYSFTACTKGGEIQYKGIKGFAVPERAAFTNCVPSLPEWANTVFIEWPLGQYEET